MRTNVTPDDFPKPDFVEVPTLEELFQRKIDIFKSIAPEYAYFLASDPVVKVLRCFALAEFFLYALLNDRARATLLTHAEGPDLDAIGQFYGVVRQVVQQADPTSNPPKLQILEIDSRYRARIADAVVAFSSAGPAAHYRFYAMSADPRVKDAAVYSPDLPNHLNSGGRVAISVLSTEGNGVPSLEVMENVKAVVTAKHVKVVSDIVDVEPASLLAIDLVANIVLDRDAPPNMMETLRKNLVAEFAKSQRLGWDAPRSWFYRVLSPQGVYETTIINPSTFQTVMPNQFPYLNTINLRFAGLAVDDEWDTDALEAARLIRLVTETYIRHAVINKLTVEQIEQDLIREVRTGIVQPSLASVVDYLGITAARTMGVLSPSDEVAELIHAYLSAYYERGYFI
jgi:phage-related baseplate assembly protein